MHVLTGGDSAPTDEITADGQTGVSFIHPMGEMFLQPLAGEEVGSSVSQHCLWFDLVPELEPFQSYAATAWSHSSRRELKTQLSSMQIDSSGGEIKS